MPQPLVLQVGLEPGHLGLALGQHEPDFAIVESEQAIAGTHPLTFEHVHRRDVGGHRRRQVRDARRVDEGVEQELGRHRPRLDQGDRYRPGALLGAQRRTGGLALDQRHHTADAGGEDQQR